MAAWKQIALAAVVLVAAAVLWARFFPGAPELMAGWGIGSGPVATSGAAPVAPSGHGAPQGTIVAQQATQATINDRLTAIGTGRANNSVAVTPFVTGRLVEILVESGDAVERGDVLARLDSDAEQIALDRARIAHDDAEARLKRIETLVSSNAVTAVQRSEAELAMRNTALALRDADLNLERRSIRSPISGTIGIFDVTLGNYVTTQSPIVTVEDRSRILVDFTVPERFASIVKVGDPIEVASVVRPDQVYAGTISAIDNRVDAASRTLKVQARITNPADTLRAGMSFRVEMRFPGDTYPAVNPLAIQWGIDGSFIWRVVDGNALRTPVRIIQRNTDSVLVDADLSAGDMVVTEGVHAVREGQPVPLARDQQFQPAVSIAAPTASGT